MLLESYHGNTFVTFIDTRVLKFLCKIEKRAYRALDKFYQIGYGALKSELNKSRSPRVERIFILDCGILLSGLDRENNEEIILQHCVIC